ncbi:MAG: O-antigen ligase family protein [Phycisphaerales bacterium]|nr:O-antigen ligase family protein [Phycisphaerales bacterium]
MSGVADGQRGEADRDSRAGVAACVAVAAALGVLLLRACVGTETLAGWETDPLIDPAPSSGMTPGVSIMIDAISLIASGWVLLATRARVSLVIAGVWAMVMAALAYHAFISQSADVSQMRVGAAWASAITLGVVLNASGVGTDRRLRALVCGLLAGFVALIVCKGTLQILVEQPSMIASFKQNSALFFQSQGWEPGSTMARAYERRVMQTEAIGWFGLSNVSASVCAAAVPVTLASAFGAWRKRREAIASDNEAGGGWGLIVGCGAMAAAAVAGVVMAGGKGGVIAMALGVGVTGALAVLVRASGRDQRRATLCARVAGAIGVLAVASALGAIALRGVIGERMSELSIWFRAFYVEASLRIFGERPLLGVGPDGFKDAYTRLKNPLSPEEVASPHSVFFDWTACLGLAGVAMSLVMLWWLWRIGFGLVQRHALETSGVASIASEDVDAAVEPRTLARLVCAVGAVCVLGSLMMERVALGPPQAVMMVGGLVLWCVLGACVMSSAMRDGFVKIGLASGAIAVATHAQIEVTGSWVQSCGVFMALVGMAASGGVGSATGVAEASETRRGVGSRVLRVAVALAGAVLAIAGAWPVMKFDRAIQDAAEPLRAVAFARATARAVKDTSIPADEQDRMLQAAGDRLFRFSRGVSVYTVASLLATADFAEATLVVEATAALSPTLLAQRTPSVRDWRIERERKRLILGTVARSAGTDGANATKLASGVFFRPVDGERGFPSKTSWDASAGGALLEAGVVGVITPAEHVAMLEACTRADSGNTRHWMALLRTLRDRPGIFADQAARLKAAAEGAVRADERMRLDKATRGLTDAERREVGAILIRP